MRALANWSPAAFKPRRSLSGASPCSSGSPSTCWATSVSVFKTRQVSRQEFFWPSWEHCRCDAVGCAHIWDTEEGGQDGGQPALSSKTVQVRMLSSSVLFVVFLSTWSPLLISVSRPPISQAVSPHFQIIWQCQHFLDNFLRHLFVCMWVSVCICAIAHM